MGPECVHLVGHPGLHRRGTHGQDPRLLLAVCAILDFCSDPVSNLLLVCWRNHGLSRGRRSTSTRHLDLLSADVSHRGDALVGVPSRATVHELGLFPGSSLQLACDGDGRGRRGDLPVHLQVGAGHARCRARPNLYQGLSARRLGAAGVLVPAGARHVRVPAQQGAPVYAHRGPDLCQPFRAGSALHPQFGVRLRVTDPCSRAHRRPPVQGHRGRCGVGSVRSAVLCLSNGLGAGHVDAGAETPWRTGSRRTVGVRVHVHPLSTARGRLESATARVHGEYFGRDLE